MNHDIKMKITDSTYGELHQCFATYKGSFYKSYQVFIYEHLVLPEGGSNMVSFIYLNNNRCACDYPEKFSNVRRAVMSFTDPVINTVVKHLTAQPTPKRIK